MRSMSEDGGRPSVSPINRAAGKVSVSESKSASVSLSKKQESKKK